MNAVVFRSFEDLWFLEKQKEAIKSLYGVDLLIASCEDDHSGPDPDITINGPAAWPACLLEAARVAVSELREDTLFFEGDMIPIGTIEKDPFIREYARSVWPSILFTGDLDLDTSPSAWKSKFSIADQFRGVRTIPYKRFNPFGFEIIGDRPLFLHPQAGTRGAHATDRIKLFKEFVQAYEDGDASRFLL